MSSAARPADLTTSEETRTERHLRLLAELAELGMRLTRTLVAQAEETPGSEADPQLAYARLTRSIRQTLALETKLAEEGRLFRERQVRQHRHQRQAQVRRLVERAIEADADDSDVDDLLCDLNERLADPDDTAFLHRPLIEVVAHICKDLGVPFDPTEWRDQAWATETASPPPLGEGDREAVEGACRIGLSSGAPPPPPTEEEKALQTRTTDRSDLGARDDTPPRHPGFRAAKDRDP